MKKASVITSKILNRFNVTSVLPTAGYYDLASAIAAVPDRYRKVGLEVTFATSETAWEDYKFIGNILEWLDTSKWKKNELPKPNALLVTDKQTGGVKQLSFEINEDGGLNLILDEIYELDTPIWEGFTLGQIFSNNIISNIPCMGQGNAANVVNNNGIWSAQKATSTTIYCYIGQTVPTPSRIYAQIAHKCTANGYTFRLGTTPTLVTQKTFEPNVWNKTAYIGNLDTTGTKTRYEFTVLGAEQQTVEIDLNNSVVVDTSMFSVQPTVEQMDNWFNEYLKLK